MTDALVILGSLVLGFGLGYGHCWGLYQSERERLARLTDRDERGRFVRREP